MLVYGAYEAPKQVGQVGSWILVDSRLEEKKYIYIFERVRMNRRDCLEKREKKRERRTELSRAPTCGA